MSDIAIDKLTRMLGYSIDLITAGLWMLEETLKELMERGDMLRDDYERIMKMVEEMREKHHELIVEIYGAKEEAEEDADE